MRWADRVLIRPCGRLETERGPLVRPCHQKVHQALSAEAARQPSVDRRLGEVRRKEGERHRHADRALGFFLARGDELNGAGRICGQFVEPAVSVAKRIDKNHARLGSHRPHRSELFAFPLHDLATSIRGWRRPRNQQDAICRFSRDLLGKLNLQRGAPDRDAFDGAQVAAEIEDVERRCGCGAVLI